MIAVISGLFSDLVNLGGNDNWGRGGWCVEGDYPLNWSKHHLSPFRSTYRFHTHKKCYKTSQELRMLSSVTINCQVTKILMNPGSQLSVL